VIPAGAAAVGVVGIRGARVARSIAAAVVVVGLLLVVAGCGDEAGSPAPRTTPVPRSLSDLDRTTKDEATRKQLEAFAQIKIPASATDLRSLSHSAMDTQLLVSFRLPAAALDAFVASGRFGGVLTDEDRAIAQHIGAQIGWRLAAAKRVKGLSDDSSTLSRNLVAVLDDPRRPWIHLEAIR